MRKWNTILSVLMLLIFMIHGIMGSFMLNGVGSSAGKLLAWIGVGILVVHTVIGVILTVQSLQTAKQSGKMYLKQNAIFWARRASGMAILILLLFHIGLFGKVKNEIFGTGHHHDALVAAGHGLGDLKRVGFECAGINAFVAVAGLG